MNHPCASINDNFCYWIGPIATTFFSSTKVLLHYGNLCFLLGHDQNPRIGHQHTLSTAIGISEHDVDRVVGHLDPLGHVHDHDVPRPNGVEVVEEVLVGEFSGGGERRGGAVARAAGGKIGEGADMNAGGGYEKPVGEEDVGGERGDGRREVGRPGGEGDGEGAEVGYVGEAEGLAGAAGGPGRGEEGERGGGAEGVEERGGGGHRVLELLGDAEDEVVGDGRRRARRGGAYRGGSASEAQDRRRRAESGGAGGGAQRRRRRHGVR